MVSLSLGLTISISRRPSSSTSPSSQSTQTPQSQPTQTPQSQPQAQTSSHTTSPCPSYVDATTYKARSLSTSHSLSLSHSNSISHRPESLEHLLRIGSQESGNKRKLVSVIQLQNRNLERGGVNMEGHGHDHDYNHEHEHQYRTLERRQSYGIGGAGNIRRPSDVIYPPRRHSDALRRRSSVWSSITAPMGTTSPKFWKRGWFLGFFRRGSGSARVGEEVANDDCER